MKKTLILLSSFCFVQTIMAQQDIKASGEYMTELNIVFSEANSANFHGRSKSKWSGNLTQEGNPFFKNEKTEKAEVAVDRLSSILVENTNIEVKLDLFVKVVNANTGKMVPNASVILFDNQKFLIAEGKTCSFGTISFEIFPAEEYVLYVTAANYKSEGITYKKEENPSILIKLQPVEPCTAMKSQQQNN